MYTVYMHTAPNGKVYIGATSLKVENRYGKNGSKYNNQYFGEAIRLFGWDKIKHEILFENLTKEEADRIEKDLISKYKSDKKEFGYNIACGGFNAPQPQIVREKMSKTRKGRPLSESHKKALSESRKGKPLSEQHRKSISISHMGYKMPQKQKDKISASCKGKGTKAVVMLDMSEKVIKKFQSIVEASQAVRAKSTSNISSCCKGKRKIAYGYKWKYAD